MSQNGQKPHLVMMSLTKNPRPKNFFFIANLGLAESFDRRYEQLPSTIDWQVMELQIDSKLVLNA